MSSTDLPHINHKRDAVYYKFSWSDDESSISEGDFQLSLKRYVDRILNETQLDNRPISCQHLPGLDVSFDASPGLVSRSENDVRSGATKSFRQAAPRSFETISGARAEIPERWESPPDRLDSGYVELHVSASRDSVIGSGCVQLRDPECSTRIDARLAPSDAAGRTVTRTIPSGRTSETASIRSSQEVFYFDDELDTIPVLLTSTGRPPRDKKTAAVQTEGSMPEADTLLGRAAKQDSEGTSIDLLDQLPLTGRSMTVVRSDRFADEWREHCLKTVVGIVTVVAGLGTMTSIAYLLIKFLILK